MIPDAPWACGPEGFLPQAEATPVALASRSGRLLGVLAAATIAVGVMAGCDADPGQKVPSPATTTAQDTRPAIASLAQPDSYPAQNYEDMDQVTADLELYAESNPDLTSPYRIFSPVSDADAIGLQTYKSAALFSVVLSADGKTLRYVDDTKGAVPAEDETALLDAVQDDSAILTGLMRAKAVHTLHFRSFAGDPNYSYPPTSYPMFVAKDPTDKKQPDIYYYLPASGDPDEQSLETMVDHEMIHAAMQDRAENAQLNDTEKAIVTQSCETLRDAALKELSADAGDIVQQLEHLRDKVPAKYTPAFNTVIEALENGTYGSLPTNWNDPTRVQSCRIQDTISAVNSVATAHGVSWDGFMHAIEKDSALGDASGSLFDNWTDFVNQSSIYSDLREASYFDDSDADNTGEGHPQDNTDETLASLTNIMLKFPSEVADNISLYFTPAAAEAYDKLISVSVGILESRYASQPTLHSYVKQQYAKYLTARTA